MVAVMEALQLEEEEMVSNRVVVEDLILTISLSQELELISLAAVLEVWVLFMVVSVVVAVLLSILAVALLVEVIPAAVVVVLYRGIIWAVVVVVHMA